MPFGHKTVTHSGKRLGGADYQKTVVNEAVRDFVEQFLSVLKGKIYRYVTTKDDIEFTQRPKRLHEIELSEVDHCPDVVLDLPRIAKE